MKLVLRALGAIVVLLVLAAAVVYVRGEPIGPLPGRHLHGTLVTQPVTDWSFVNHPGICQIEVDSDPPRAVNIGCFGDQKYLYVSHNILPNHRPSWAELLALSPTGRIRYGTNLYPVKAIRISDQTDRQRIWTQRNVALNHPNPDSHVPDNLLMFELVSR